MTFWRAAFAPIADDGDGKGDGARRLGVGPLLIRIGDRSCVQLNRKMICRGDHTLARGGAAILRSFPRNLFVTPQTLVEFTIQS